MGYLAEPDQLSPDIISPAFYKAGECLIEKLTYCGEKSMLYRRYILKLGVNLQNRKKETMGNKLYVGNLSYNTTEEDLEVLCKEHGAVGSVRIISDRNTGRSKGFGFVEMGTDEEAQAAISALNGTEVDGRQIKVNEAQERPKRDNNR